MQIELNSATAIINILKKSWILYITWIDLVGLHKVVMKIFSQHLIS